MKTKELKKLIKYWPDDGEVHIEGCELEEHDIWCVATDPEWREMNYETAKSILINYFLGVREPVITLLEALNMVSEDDYNEIQKSVEGKKLGGEIMIDAKTAKEKAVMHDDFRNYMDKIEGAVNKAVEKGLFSTSVKHNIEESEKGRMLYGLLNHELSNLGYEFTCKWCESMPASCRSDQWDFYNGDFRISW